MCRAETSSSPPLRLQLAMSPACLETKQCGDKRINFLTGVVEGERRPD